MLKDKHVHKFKRDTYSTGKKFYYCINGNCTFKIDVKHSLGKFNICHSCGNTFQMNEYSIRAANPKCMDCIKRRSINPVLKETDNANPMVKPTIDSVSDLESRLHPSSNLQTAAKVIEYNPDDETDDL